MSEVLVQRALARSAAVDGANGDAALPAPAPLTPTSSPEVVGLVEEEVVDPAFQPSPVRFPDLPASLRDPVLAEFHADVDVKVAIHAQLWALQIGCGRTEEFFRSFSTVIEDALILARVGKPRAI